MKRISVELVPRSEEGLRQDLQLLKENISGVNLINILDFRQREDGHCDQKDDHG